MVEPKDYPFDEVAKTAKELADNGALVYQKFTCDKCGSRQTIDEANKFFTTGRCEECDHVTDIRKKGCNYMVYIGINT